MRKDVKGFTLLEIAVCFVLFAILLEALWGFFGNIYGEFMQFDKKITLNNEADAIESFLKDYIREADKIKITTADGKIIEVMKAKDASGVDPDSNNPNNIEITDAEIKTIETEKTELSSATPPTYITTNSKVELSAFASPTGNQGEKQLKYQALDGIGGGNRGTAKLISDQVENIKISRKKDSDLVELTCTLHKKDETNERLKVIFKFSVNLSYKERLS